MTILFFHTKTFSQGIVSNIIDERGLKQGFWYNYKIDTLIEKWVAIIETKDNNSSGIDTFICKSIYSKGNYINNKKDSIWKVYDTQKNKTHNKINYGNLLFEVNFKNDSLTGILKTYYSTGILKSEIEFINNNSVGNIKCYWDNGKLKFSGNIKFGVDYFDGYEYNIKGLKINNRKFNSKIILKEWTNIDDLFARLNK